MNTRRTDPERSFQDSGTAPDPTLEIGARLATHRTRRGMKVSALAREIGVSASLISQIERGQSRPSVSTLLALAEALDVAVDAFFRDPDDDGTSGTPAREAEDAPARDVSNGDRLPRDERYRRAGRRTSRYVVRRDERAAIAIEGGVRWERLTPTQLDELEFMELVYGPQAESHATQYRHPGTEMVLVLDGRLEISVGPERYELETGDSLCFPSTTPHRYVNPTERTTRAVTVILPEGIAQPTTNRRA